MSREQPCLNLLLLGKTGHGKSDTGNSILGLEAFKVSDASFSETKICTLECSKRDDTLIRVVDTPGLLNVENTIEFTLTQIGHAMSLCPGGFNVIIFVVSFGSRFTEEERQVFDTLKQYFGENILRDFGVIVMSHGDSFYLKHNKKITFKEWLNEQKSTDGDSRFVQLLNECNNRCVLFYNSGEMFESLKQESVREMFDLICRDIPTPYTSNHFEQAKITRETLVRKLRLPALCAEIQEKLCLLSEQLNSDIKNNVVSYDAMKNKIKEIENELVKFDDDSKEFHHFKKQIDGLKEKFEKIRETECNNKAKLKEQQKQMMKDMETIKNPPSRDIPNTYASNHVDKATTTSETFIRKLRETEIQEKLILLMDQLKSDMKNIDAMTHNIKEIEKDLDKLNDDSKEFHYFKRQFDGLTETLTKMKKTENDKVKQRNQQESIFNNLKETINSKCSVM